MTGVVWTPGFGYSKEVTASDSADNCVGAVGLHNGSATGGLVKVTYVNGVSDTIYIAGGVYLTCRPARVWLTGTDAGVQDKIHALYA